MTGVVTVVGPSGFFLQDDGAPSAQSAKQQQQHRGPSPHGSPGIYVFSAAAAARVAAGDRITLGRAAVAEFRSSTAHIPLTGLICSPADVTTLPAGNALPAAVELGRRGWQPPTRHYSALDSGDVFGLPNGHALVLAANATLAPAVFGLDFWESLSGRRVRIAAPVALGAGGSFGDVWVRGDWPVSGLNRAGGLTLTSAPAVGTAGTAGGNDANPEAVLVGSPLDGSHNPGVRMGDVLGPIEGVVTQAFGFYSILPATAITVKSARDAAAPPTRIASRGSCKGITVGQYSSPPSYLPSLLILPFSHSPSPHFLILILLFPQLILLFSHHYTPTLLPSYSPPILTCPSYPPPSSLYSLLHFSPSPYSPILPPSLFHC